MITDNTMIISFAEAHSEVQHAVLSSLLALLSVLCFHTNDARLRLFLHPLHHHPCTTDLALTTHEIHQLVLPQFLDDELYCFVYVHVVDPFELYGFLQNWSHFLCHLRHNQYQFKQILQPNTHPHTYKQAPYHHRHPHYIQITIYSLMNPQKKLRNIILQLAEPHKIRLLQLYTQQNPLQTHVKQISFNCHESTLHIHNHIYNGYGKTHHEALTAGVNMFLQAHLKNQANHQALKETLKKLAIQTPISPNHQKIKTQPDILIDKSRVQIVGRTSFGSTKQKQPVSKPTKSIKQQIFQSLNRGCFKKAEQPSKTKQMPQTLSKQPSSACLGQFEVKNAKKSQMQSILSRVRQLQQKLGDALNQNQYLKRKLQQKERKEQELSMSYYHQKENISAKENAVENYNYHHHQNNNYVQNSNQNGNNNSSQNNNNNSKKEMSLHYRQSKEGLADITNKMSALLDNKDNYKLRSFSMSNTTNNSNFNSKIQSKVKIPKLNLQILPNYHGKSNKSLNQSLLQSYQKKIKVNSYM